MNESMGYDLTKRDRADGVPCPMERLADRFMDAPSPKWLKRHASREHGGYCCLVLEGWLSSPDQIDDLINYLGKVKG